MRRQTNKNNENINIFERLSRRSLRQNAVAPDLFIRPLGLPDDEPTGVEIVELNSSNETETSPRAHHNASHAWSYVNKDEMQHIEHSYKVNRNARKRRKRNHQTLPSDFMPEDSDDSNSGNNVYSNQLNLDDTIPFNHQINCFSILDKNIGDPNASADEEYEDDAIIASEDIIIESGNWNQHNNFYNEEIITYDTDLDQETRTIWIYSIKNKHLLSGEDFATVISPIKENSSTSYSTDSSGEQVKDDETFYRLGSPTTACYVPKLDLSLVPTLSTVVELSERNLQLTSDQSKKSTSRIRPNNWFIPESAKDSVRSVRKHEKLTNIINWMALSPRKRRRVLNVRSLSDKWVGPCLDSSPDSKEDRRGVYINKKHAMVQNDGVKIKVDVEVHVDRNDKPNKTNTELGTANTTVKSKNDMNTSTIKYADAILKDFPIDRGDHEIKLISPVINLSPNIHKTKITDPIDKLETNDWIYDKEEKETSVYDYVLRRSESILEEKNINVVDHVWFKSTIPFLKSSQWTRSEAIAESPVSFNKISVGSIGERTTWFRRLINFLKCCK